jgi:uncharacterized protein
MKTDYLIVGSGLSALVFGALMSKAGKTVRVLEAHEHPGGFGHSFTMSKKYTFNVQLHYVWDCGEGHTVNRVLKQLDLDRSVTFDRYDPEGFDRMRMTELEVELEPVNIGSALFLKNGTHYLSKVAIDRNFTGIKRFLESWRMNLFYLRSASLFIAAKFWDTINFRDRSVADSFQQPSLQNTWLKLFAMYSYSIPFSQIDDCPAELVIPTLRDDVFVDWVRIKGGVYSYIQKILDRFKGKILLGVEVAAIRRTAIGVWIDQSSSKSLRSIYC